MYITFYGAVREVTGSLHMICTETDRVLFDCGMFQGRRKESAAKNRVFPFDPSIITTLVLSHAHIDHSGRIPLLVQKNFRGRIVCTRPTADACLPLLLDSAYIQESDAEYLNYKIVRNALSQLKKHPDGVDVDPVELAKIKQFLKKSRHEINTEVIHDIIEKYHLEGIHPLYTVEDAEACQKFIDGYPYRYPIDIGKDMTCTLYEAGHILGSAFSIVKAKENGQQYTICYSGDIGRFDKPIIKNPTLQFPEEDRHIDLLIMESTYGNRVHEPVNDLKPHLKNAIIDTINRGGSILIPAFAFGRTQEIVYLLHELYQEHEIPEIPIYVDSPLASKLTKVFGEHPEVYSDDTHEIFLQKGQNPFMFDLIRFTQSTEESIALVQDETPKIVIASSGMCEGGRILHHLRYKIHNPKHTILIVGYMAENTLGRRILEQGLAYQESEQKGEPPVMKFLNKSYPLRAQVVNIGGFSAHADKIEMLRFLKESNLDIKSIAVVHGEEEQSLSFADYLKQEGFSSFVPKVGETVLVKK